MLRSGRRIADIVKGLALGAITVAAPRAFAEQRVAVVVYDGWGTPTSFSLSGRVLEEQGERAAALAAGEAENIVDNLKALESDEVRGAHVRVTMAGRTFSATTDDDGVFVVEAKGLPQAQALPLGAVPVRVALVKTAGLVGRDGEGHVFIHDPARPFVAVVSDIDDTIVKTHVTDTLKLAATVLLKNAAQLEPVEGAAACYRKARDAGVAQFFYLSGSPQNFHRRLRTYLDLQGFPAGPLLLKNIGDDSLTQQQGYKAQRLERLLRDLPSMRIVLVGDTGEKDPEIYAELRRRHPDRVAGIIIRKTPGVMVPPARLEGMVSVDDRYAPEDVIARLLAPAGALSPGAAEPR